LLDGRLEVAFGLLGFSLFFSSGRSAQHIHHPVSPARQADTLNLFEIIIPFLRLFEPVHIARFLLGVLPDRFWIHLSILPRRNILHTIPFIQASARRRGVVRGLVLAPARRRSEAAWLWKHGQVQMFRCGNGVYTCVAS